MTDGEGDDAADDGLAYERIRAQLCDHFGWLPSHVDEMPFDVIESVCRMGQKRKGIRVKSADEARAVSRNWRRQLGM